MVEEHQGARQVEMQIEEVKVARCISKPTALLFDAQASRYRPVLSLHVRCLLWLSVRLRLLHNHCLLHNHRLLDK